MANSVYKYAYLPVTGGDAGVWGGELNTQTFATFDAALGGYAAISVSNANVTLSSAQAGAAILRITGTLTGNVQVTSACQGFTYVENLTTGNFTVSITNGVGTPLVLAQSSGSNVIFDATNGARLGSGAGFVPPGVPLPYAGTVSPPGFLLCYGQLVSIATYPTLYNVWGITFGSGSGTFGIPDLRGRTWFGLDNMGGAAAGRLAGGHTGNIASGTTLGSTGGEENHANTAAETALHTHSGTTGTESQFHTHSLPLFGNGGGLWSGGPNATSNSSQTGTESQTHTHNFTTDNGTGGGQSHNTTPPGMVGNWIIKT